LVLLIDNDQDSLALSALALSGMGFELMAAREFGEALRRATAHTPDVIVTELQIGDTPSWDLIQRLKADERTRKIPVVVFTGDGGPSTVSRAREAGCTLFLEKPCAPYQLAATLHKVVISASAKTPIPTRH
jgi:two-component system chemotaxis response regulator CheY